MLALKNIDPSTLPHQASAFNLFGFLGIMMVTVVLVIGIKESANLNSVIVVIKVCVLIVFLILGGNYILGHPPRPLRTGRLSYRRTPDTMGISAGRALRPPRE